VIPLDDRGLLLGDGLFETLLCRSGELVLVEDHARRMADGAAVLGLPAPSLADFTACALEAVAAAGLAEARAAVRVTWTAGSGGRGLDRPAAIRPRLFATAASTRVPGPARMVVATVRRNEASPASRLKSLAYLDNVLARREALAAGADEAVMLNVAGDVACAAAANLFWIKDGVLFTPPPETGCLDGIMARQVRSAVSGLGVDVRWAVCGPAMLEQADALFLTNSLVGLRPAVLGDDPVRSHQLVERLTAAVARYG
jgi:branched-chain amino acid aminotransferase/4-amino-4-deoxychorismate lyase